MVVAVEVDVGVVDVVVEDVDVVDVEDEVVDVVVDEVSVCVVAGSAVVVEDIIGPVDGCGEQFVALNEFILKYTPPYLFPSHR